MALKMKGEAEPKEKPKQSVKTVVIWSEGQIGFFIIEGDYSHLNQKFMDSSYVTEKESTEICKLMFDGAEGKKLRKKISLLKSFPLLPVMQGAKVIVTGYLP